MCRAKERKVPFGNVARQHLNTYLQYWRGKPLDLLNERVFLDVFGKPMAQSAVQKMFERLAELANIHDKRVSAHTYRHWFAVNAIKQGMPTAALRDMLGHETWAMIEVYVHEQDMKLSTWSARSASMCQCHQWAWVLDYNCSKDRIFSNSGEDSIQGYPSSYKQRPLTEKETEICIINLVSINSLKFRSTNINNGRYKHNLPKATLHQL